MSSPCHNKQTNATLPLQVAELLAEHTGLGEFTLNISILILALVAFTPVCGLLWGAIFNPLNSLALIITGKGELSQNVLRMVGLAWSHMALQLVTLGPKEYFEESSLHGVYASI